MRILMVGFLLLAALPGLAPAAEEQGVRPREIELFGQGQEDGTMTDFVVSESAAERSPAWNPEADDPPLSVSRAVAIAKKLFLAAHPKYDHAKLFSVDIMSVGSWHVRDRWFYVVSFSPVVDGEPMMSNSEPIVLLMDGTVAEARRGKR